MGKPAALSEDDLALEERIRQLPPQMGALLIATGTVGGLFVPGLPGLVIAMLGGMLLAPRQPALARADGFLRENLPELRIEAFRFVDRFHSDLNRRFPGGKKASAS